MITVIMAFYNDAGCLREAITAILNQTYKNFELIAVDDCSTDGSYELVRSFKDKRIRILRNKENKGIAKTRNSAIPHAKGQYIFFTDSDCVVHPDWLKEGLKPFKNKDCVGVEGYTIYIKKGYVPSISDKVPGTLEQGHYMTCNIGYKKSILQELGGLDERYCYNDDRELALRVLERGKIYYCDKMCVTHQKKLWTVNSRIKSARRAADRVLLFKDHGEKEFFIGRIMYPRNLVKILFPPLILLPLFKHKNKTFLDYKIVLASYIRFLYERYIIWKSAIRYRIFVV